MPLHRRSHTLGCACDEPGWRRERARRLLAAEVGADASAGAGEPAATSRGNLLRLPRRQLGALANGAFVHPLVEVYGDVVVGARSFIAGTTILYAAAGRSLVLAESCNCQDNSYLLADERDVRFAAEASIAHQASIVDSEVGSFTFIGFRARVINAVVGDGSMVLHNALVEGVAVPPGRKVPPGARITTQAEADALPPADDADGAFMTGVQGVNQGFADAYSRLFRDEGRDAVEGVRANPPVPFNPVATRPTVGAGFRLGEMSQIIGDVRIGDDSRLRQRCSLRADEGTPIVVGRRARIGSRLTMHALRNTRIDVGDNLVAGDEVVIHGPVVVGDNVTVEDGAVVFRATVEDHVIVRAGATIAGDCVIREGSIVPENAVVLTQADADALPRP